MLAGTYFSHSELAADSSSDAESVASSVDSPEVMNREGDLSALKEENQRLRQEITHLRRDLDQLRRE